MIKKIFFYFLVFIFLYFIFITHNTHRLHTRNRITHELSATTNLLDNLLL